MIRYPYNLSKKTNKIYAKNPKITILNFTIHLIGCRVSLMNSLLLYKFTEHINKYVNDFNMHNFQCTINDIQILKYTKGGHYKLHCDHGPAVPRTLSLIYFVNDDYQGGDLIFKLINTNDEIKIQNKKNRLIIWPSNFMYPHCVTPVTNGVRYSVVAWAL